MHDIIMHADVILQIESNYLYENQTAQETLLYKLKTTRSSLLFFMLPILWEVLHITGNEKLCNYNLVLIVFRNIEHVIHTWRYYTKPSFLKLQSISPVITFLRPGKALLLQICIAMKQSLFSDFVREGNILSQMTFIITTNVMTNFKFLCIYNMVIFPIGIKFWYFVWYLWLTIC